MIDYDNGSIVITNAGVRFRASLTSPECLTMFIGREFGGANAVTLIGDEIVEFLTWLYSAAGDSR